MKEMNNESFKEIYNLNPDLDERLIVGISEKNLKYIEDKFKSFGFQIINIDGHDEKGHIIITDKQTLFI